MRRSKAGTCTSTGSIVTAADRPGNASTKFAKVPEFTAADYYDRSRARTYASCFSFENSEYIWREYRNGGTAGKICLVFNFGRLREMLNAVIESQEAAMMCGDLRCAQIFSINYGIVEYVDWEEHLGNAEHLPNPVTYIYLKDKTFEAETELRVSLSALGLGRFVLADGSEIAFPHSLAFDFEYRAACESGVIERILLSPDCDKAHLDAQLARFGMASRT